MHPLAVAQLSSAPQIAQPCGEQRLHCLPSIPPLAGMPTDKRVISISGDGGFLFCAQELETAV